MSKGDEATLQYRRYDPVVPPLLAFPVAMLVYPEGREGGVDEPLLYAKNKFKLPVAAALSVHDDVAAEQLPVREMEEAGAVTVKLMPLLARPETVTVTFPVVAPRGTETTIAVGLQLVGVATVPLNVIVLAP